MGSKPKRQMTLAAILRTHRIPDAQLAKGMNVALCYGLWDKHGAPLSVSRFGQVASDKPIHDGRVWLRDATASYSGAGFHSHSIRLNPLHFFAESAPIREWQNRYPALLTPHGCGLNSNKSCPLPSQLEHHGRRITCPVCGKQYVKSWVPGMRRWRWRLSWPARVGLAMIAPLFITDALGLVMDVEWLYLILACVLAIAGMVCYATGYHPKPSDYV